jgi:cation diffusion facilitator CzcD-associated flavoprotein CzcO
MEFIGEGGAKLSEVWKPDPVAYFSLNPPKMPNMFTVFGPNSAPFAASIVHTFEGASHYIIKCIQKIQLEYIKSMVCK